MADSFRGWVQQNSVLVTFLGAQTFAILTATLSITAYMVRLETRVTTLEVRGSPHLERIDQRLAVLESVTAQNKQSVDRLVTIITDEFAKRSPGRPPP
jgi:hypothetical protein